MGFHTFPIERADALDDPSRYRYCSREELLEMLNPATNAAILDLGSGTGFYTSDVAPFVGDLYAVDMQPEMHDRHLKQRVVPNVFLVTAAITQLPFGDDSLDGAFSTMTHHEYGASESMEEIARVLRPGSRLVTIDWSALGSGEDGPPLDERFEPSEIVAQLERAGFTIDDVRTRPETVAICATI